MQKLRAVVVLLLSLNGLLQAEKTYNGYRVLSVQKILKKEQLDVLKELQKQPGIDFWSEPSSMRTTDIMVPPEDMEKVESLLKSHGLQYEVMIKNVQNMVEKEPPVRENRQGGMNWNKYHRLDVIYAWMDAQANLNPSLVQISNIGKSWEGRPLKMARVATNNYNNNPMIVVDSGIHAREWIGPATSTYIMKQLISVPIEDRDLLDSIDWYFIPVVNPDGYEYTHTEDRLWRKTRSNHNGANCRGVDANRNFNFHWNGKDKRILKTKRFYPFTDHDSLLSPLEAGTKDDPCANTYPGPYAFSEPEANATAKFLWENRKKIRAYLTLHSYSQLFLTPYGYTEDLPEDYDDLHDLGTKAAKALEEVHGTEYEVGAPSHILYANSGSSRDWAKGVPEIKYPFTIELRDKGESGFILPSSEILPTGEETWEAVKIIARKVISESQKASYYNSDY